MQQKKRVKLCPNCDGQLDIDVKFCSYCGADLSDTISEKASLSPEETLSSLYPPPYQSKVNPSSFTPPKAQAATFSEAVKPKEEKALSKNNFLWSIVLFFLGINLFVISLLIFIFSHNGELFLKWDNAFALVYFLGSLPLLILGFRGLTRNNT